MLVAFKNSEHKQNLARRFIEKKMNTNLLWMTLTFLTLVSSANSADVTKPNIILIFCDDLGYGDLGYYGSTKNRTPNIDQLAKEGMKFTNFYSSSPVCTPSRASLLTGCYPRRVGMHEDFTGHWVLIPRSRRGLHPKELTIAEALKARGYKTACIGKWHLGDQPEHLPTRHGFDSYFGIPYSNDMQSKGRGDPPLPLVKQDKVIEAPVDQSMITKRYTEEAVKFIEKNQANPFFVYLPHTFPHVPIFASPDFMGKSKNGRYGDSVEEIDWSTGQIIKCLERLKIAENTLVIFTSDNGSNRRNGGSNSPLSGAKGSTMEGGMRVPMIARWPGRVPANGVCEELATTMDFLPTFCSVSGAGLSGNKIDGYDISKMIAGDKQARSKYKAFYYYRRRQLQAIRAGDWKYHLPLAETHPNWNSPKRTGPGRKGKLFNLKDDLAEKNNVAETNPEVIKRMKALAADAISRLGNDAIQGSEQRESLTLDSSKPMIIKQ